MIELRGVDKTFDSTTAVSGMDLRVPPGRTTILIGPSGCGKSTTLRLVNGLIQPGTGEILVEEERLSTQDLNEVRRRIGYVIQDGGLFPHLTARENVALVADYLGWNDARIDERIDELTGLVGLASDRLDQFPTDLSGGQQQRVGLMRALMLDPPILLLDEPLGALDPMIRSRLQEDLRAIFERLKKTVVFVTHDMGEALYFGEHIVLMRAGEIVQQGTPDELLESPAEAFVEEFINAQRSPLTAEGGS